MLQNTKTALQHIGIQYTVTILGNQGRCLTQGKFNVKFSFFKLFLISVSSGYSYMLTK